MGVRGASYIVVSDIPSRKLDFFGVSKRIQPNATNKIGPTPRASEDALRVPGGDPAVRSVRNQVPVPGMALGADNTAGAVQGEDGEEGQLPERPVRGAAGPTRLDNLDKLADRRVRQPET